MMRIIATTISNSKSEKPRSLFIQFRLPLELWRQCEASLKSPDKKGAEAILLDELRKNTDALPEGRQVMFKLTLPDVADLYQPLMNHKRVARVVALSGGYTRDDACKRLAANHGMIASFSRALVQDLRVSMNDAEFEEALAKSIDEISRASTVKV